MGLMKKIFGSYNDKEVKRVLNIVIKIEKLDEQMKSLTNEELQHKTTEFKERLANGETLDDILVEAFAVCREASFRVLNMKHFREQMIGGIVLHQGRIAEMKTGEGKTLVATLPAYLNALSGKGVHVITVNDYLAQRDAAEMSQLYGFLGLTTGVVIHGLTPQERKDAYNCDITYGTNNEFGFDYLRDNMVIYKEEKSQRKLNFCIVDEVDSILIDEARTPLIISGPGEKSTEFYKIADMFAKQLKIEEDFTIDEKGKAVLLTDSGIEKAETTFTVENYADADNLALQHYVTQALKANFIMKRDVDYMVKDNEIMIVDEFTGRLMEGRRYSDGLHQAIEAKEDVEVQRESKTLATITFQNYFRMYDKLSGMTGTAATEESEFREIYALDVIVIPTHRPIQRKDLVDLVYTTQKGKYNAIVEEIIEANKKGQPILVGTTSIEKSEYISSLLKARGIEHQVLNAKYHDIEAEIVANAGEVGRITIATNMAGRGTDIKLKQEALDAGGLKIIGTERHESRRIDNQLRGRSGRQGDVGESRFYLSLEDDLMRLFGSEKILGISEKLGLTEDQPIEASMVSKAIENAQKKVEGAHFNARKHVLGYDDVMNMQRSVIYTQRDEVLDGENLQETIEKMIRSQIDEAVDTHLATDYEEERVDLCKTLLTYLEDLCMPHKVVTIDDLAKLSNEEVKELCAEHTLKSYRAKEEIYGSENMRELERVVLLRCVDKRWMEHIDNMEHLKQGVALRAYKQQDPVQAYQMEGSAMFEEMVSGIKHDTVKYLTHVKVQLPTKAEEEIEQESTENKEN